MLLSKQEKLRLLKIEQEYENSLLTIEDLSNHYKKSRLKLEKREQELKQLQQRVSFYQGEITKYNEITLEVEDYVEKKEDEISTLNSNIMDYELKVKTLNLEKETLSNKINDMEKAYNETRNQLKVSEDEKLLKSEKLEVYEGQINELVRLMEETETVFSEKESELSNLKDHTRGFELELKQRLIELEQANKELRCLKDELNHKEIEWNQLSNNYKKLELELNQSIDENKNIKKELQVCVNKHNDTKKELQVCVNKHNDTKKELQVCVNKHNDTKKELQVCVNKHNETKKELQVCVNKHNETMKELQVYMNKHNETKNELQVYMNKHNETKNELQEKTNIIKNLHEENLCNKKEYEDVREVAESLTSRVSELEKIELLLEDKLKNLTQKLQIKTEQFQQEKLELECRYKRDIDHLLKEKEQEIEVINSIAKQELDEYKKCAEQEKLNIRFHTKQELDDYKKNVTSQQEELIAKFQKERLLLENQITATKYEKDQLNKQIENSNMLQAQANEKILDYERLVRDKDELIEQRKQHIYRLEQKLYKINQEELTRKDEFTEKQVEITQLSKVIDKLTLEQNELQGIINHLNTNMKEALLEKGNLLNAIKEKDAIINSVELDLKKQKGTSLEQYKAIAKQNQKLDEQTKIMQELLYKNDELQSRFNSLYTQYDMLKKKDKDNNQEKNQDNNQEKNQLINQEVMQELLNELDEKNKNIDELETQILELMLELEDTHRS